MKTVPLWRRLLRQRRVTVVDKARRRSDGRFVVTESHEQWAPQMRERLQRKRNRRSFVPGILREERR